MPEPLAHLYDLALRTLDEQERRAEALRGRLGPLLAAAALGASLLGAPVAGGARPLSAVGASATLLAFGGLLAMLVPAFRLTSARRRTLDGLDARRLLVTLKRDGHVVDEAAFYVAMITRIGDQAEAVADTVDRLAASITVMLWGILVMLCGLALAALVR